MEDKKSKQPETGQHQEQNDLIKKADVRDQIISEADELIFKAFTDEGLDKELEKQLLSDLKKHSPKRAYVTAELKPYLKKFPLEFYKQIYRLRGWATDGKKLYKRPAIVGAWTNEIIYYRFPPEVIATLREKNPYIGRGHRMFKHFQWLTMLGEDQLKQFISDAIRLMTESKYWAEFKRKLAIEAGLPYQGDVFENS